MKTTLNLKQVILLLCVFLGTNLIASNTEKTTCNDNAAFSLICPSDVYISCTDQIFNLSAYGDAYVHDYNGTSPAGNPVVTYNLNSCNIGQIYRTWTVEDYNWVMHTCTQVINVSGTGGFDPSHITWPADVSLTGCNPNTDPNSFPPGQDKPTYLTQPCSTVGVSMKDQTFYFNTTCRKIIRTWTVLDWCQYVPGTNKGKFSYNQIIKISDDEAPTVDCPAAYETNSHNCLDAEVVRPDLHVDASSCGGIFEVSNNSPYADNNGANLSGIYPVGTTTVQFIIKYGCGHKVYCYQDIIVKDALGPQPYCWASITTALMPVDNDGDGIPEDGMIEIWATDLDKDSYSPCGHEPLQYSFSETDIVTNKTFTCADVGDNFVNMYVHDALGNVSFCTVKVVVQNNGANIPNCVAGPTVSTSTSDISGRISNIFDTTLEDITLECSYTFSDTLITSVSDTITTYEVIDSFYNASGVLIYHLNPITNITTLIDTSIIDYSEIQQADSNGDGDYKFDSVEMHRDYMVTGLLEKPTDKLVTNCDLQILLDHLMDKEKITDPYQLIAADVNQSGQIDYLDLHEMLKYIEGKIEKFSARDPYLLIDSDYSFIDPTNPFNEDLDQYRSYQDLSGPIQEANFIYIHRGDLCNEDSNQSQNSNPMNLLQTFSDKLPQFLKQEIKTREAELLSPAIAEFSVYPNPFVSTFQVSINNPVTQEVNIKITNSQGQVVYNKAERKSAGNHLESINLSDRASSGIYFYQISAGKSQSYGRLIKR